jgi:hypothetical protein
MIAAFIAKSAHEQIGTRFRLHGRRGDEALDCAGLVEHCLKPFEKFSKVPTNYTMRGRHVGLAESFFRQNNFSIIMDEPPVDGDIAVVRCEARQIHLLIRSRHAWVHAHAGLGRVVLTPDPLPWPIIQLWRAPGE